ncbi:hypothetical protein [Photorhabdus sp. SF281]
MIPKPDNATARQNLVGTLQRNPRHNTRVRFTTGVQMPAGIANVRAKK